LLVNIEPSSESVARDPQKRGALGHGLFGLCVNPSLVVCMLLCISHKY